MPKIGLGRWLLSWITKPLVAIGQSFERILSIARGVDSSITQSAVAGAYRSAETALDLAPTIASMDRHEAWPIGIMGEEKLGRARNYLVEFDVQVLDTDTGERYMSTRKVYFMRRMSASEYEAEYLKDFAGDPYEEGQSIEGAKAVDVVHNRGLAY